MRLNYLYLLICGVWSILVVFCGFTSGADLRSDLREIFALIPRRRVGFIAARHLILDPRFRVAADYIRGNDFPVTWQSIRNTPEFIELVQYARTHVGPNYNITQVIDRIPSRLRGFRIPAQVPVELMFQRNLATFLREVVRAMPRARISAVVSRKVQEGGEFARLYESLNKEDFMLLIQKARKSENLSKPIDTLSRHAIDVDELIDIGFQLLTWGPQT